MTIVLAAVTAVSVVLVGPAATATTTATTATGSTTRSEATSTGPGGPRVTSRVTLPRPTGVHPVGRDTLHLVDTARRDPWMPTHPRELMVDVYYPAATAPVGRGAPARYADPAEIRLYLASLGLDGVLSAEDIATTTIASRTGVPPLSGHHPLVLLSPGLGVGRRSLTGLAEQFASRGYVAATVDHAYESVGTLFPGARMLTCLACDRIQRQADLSAAVRSRTADLSFVLDRLVGPRPAWRGAATIDPTKVAAVGHSLGGAASVALLAQDRRVRVGVDLDGTLGEPVPSGGLPGRAVLLLGAAADHPAPGPGGQVPPGVDPDDYDPTWAQAWARLRAPRLWLDVEGADHFSFTDDPVIADQLPPPPSTGTGSSTGVVPTMSGARALAITRACVDAFVTRALTGDPAPLPDDLSRAYPEVRVIGR
ncbi:lipase [Frankia sp. R82]|uniref:alpha/beta hydrolase family protein n=1 Tax=Frankia sp. R82 TaxID=2950553 RepID=UPI002042CA9D|nr:lipase [Frankia sp. R82]MCM3887178.1 lipase [Frankia sp. R82]